MEMNEKVNKELLEILEAKAEVLRKIRNEQKESLNKTKGKVIIENSTKGQTFEDLAVDGSINNAGLFYTTYENKRELKNLRRTENLEWRL